MSSTLIDRTIMTGVSPSLVKAVDSESTIRRFESYYPCHVSFPFSFSFSFSFFLLLLRFLHSVCFTHLWRLKLVLSLLESILSFAHSELVVDSFVLR